MTAKSRLHTFGRSCHLVITGPYNNSEELVAMAKNELVRLEDKFSAYRETSVISRINQAAGTGSFSPLDAEGRSLFKYASTLWEQSKHLFDPTIRLLQNCYNDEGELLSTETQLADMLSLVGWSHMEVGKEGARLSKKGMVIDLNSCVCAYAVDSVRKILLKEGVESALIEMDQDVVTIGRQTDGANWLVGVRHPKGSRAAIARLKVNGMGLTRRGDYERRVMIKDEYFGRGLSPVDGHPVPGLLSVIVVAENCLTACSAASIARLKTEKTAMQWLDGLGMQWMAIDRKLACHGPLAPRRGFF